MSDTPGGPEWFKASDGKWYPPAQPSTAPQFASTKKKGGCLKAMLIGFGVFVVLIIVISVAAGSSSSKTTQKASATCAGKSYPDHQKSDVCADGANSLVLNGVTITATPFVSQDNGFGSKALCSNVTIKNGSSKSQDYNIFDFKIQTPGGDVATTSSIGVGETLNSGTLIAGASKTGLVCTDDKGEKGQYVFIYKPNPFLAARGTWLFNVA